MVAFGGGADLRVSDEPQINRKSLSDFGNSFELPDGIEYGSEEAKSYFAGGFNFKVQEMEVFFLA